MSPWPGRVGEGEHAGLYQQAGHVCLGPGLDDPPIGNPVDLHAGDPIPTTQTDAVLPPSLRAGPPTHGPGPVARLHDQLVHAHGVLTV